MQPQNPNQFDPSQQPQPTPQPQPQPQQWQTESTPSSSDQQVPVAPQPVQPPAPAYPSFADPVSQPIEDPGKKLATFGNILAISVFLAPIGLVISLIARKKSKDAGYPTKLATIGVMTNGAFLLLGIVGIIAFFAVMGSIKGLYSDDQSSTSSSQTQTTDDTSSTRGTPMKSLTLPAGTVTKGASEAEVTKAMGKDPVECTVNKDGSTSCYYSENLGDLFFFENGKLRNAILENGQVLQ
jgi:hypothetical protein